MGAKKRSVETAVFCSTVPLDKCGRDGTFKRALAENLATTGLTEAEYVQIAKKMRKADYRFKAYIKHFIEKGYDIEELENGRYVEKKEPSKSASSSTLTQVPLNGEIPTREEIEKVLSGIAPKGKEIDEDVLKSAVEYAFSLDGRTLKSNWWEITKENL